MKAPGSLDDLIPLQSIVELRYPRAHRYWDVSGALIAKVEERIPQLRCRRLGEEGFEFRGVPGSGISSALFFWERASVSTDMSGSHDRFDAAAAEFFSLVIDGLGVETVRRLGNRYLYLFPNDQAQGLLDERPLWRGSEAMAAFGEPQSNGSIFRTQLPSFGRRLRLEIESGDGEVQGKSQMGVRLDVDFAREPPPQPQALAIQEFLGWNRRFIRENLHKVLR